MTTPRVPQRTASWGAYGLSLADAVGGELVARSRHRLVAADGGWPVWEVRLGVQPPAGGRTGGSVPPAPSELGPDRAILRGDTGGVVVIDRLARATTFETTPLPDPEALVHPYLASTAAVAAHWLGRAAFHAGGVVIDGRAWGILGARRMGKSSLLMALHTAGLPIVADDLMVVEDGLVYSGPRCLDLREAAAEHFGAGEALGRVGRRDRWRVGLPPVPGAVPLAGWVLLGWGAGLDVQRLAAGSALSALAACRAVVAPGAVPPRLLDVAAWPVLLFARPQRWEAMPAAVDALVAALAVA